MLRLLVGIASLMIAIAGLKILSDLLGPILLSLFVVLLCLPLLSWLKNKGIPGWLAYTLIIIGVILTSGIFIVYLIASLTNFSESLPEYQSILNESYVNLQQWLDQYNIQAKDILKLKILSPEKVFQFIGSIVTGLLGAVSSLGLTLLIFIYMLGNASSVARILRKNLGEDSQFINRCYEFTRSVSTYLFIKSGLGVMTALGQIILLWIFGVDFPVLWGVLSFLFNFIPNVGFYISLIPPVILALLKLGLVKAVIIAVIYSLINNFFDIVIAPRYLGKGLDLSTLVTFLAVILWAWIFGPVGAFLALPLTIMVKKLILETFTETQLLAKLMSGQADEGTIGVNASKII